MPNGISKSVIKPALKDGVDFLAIIAPASNTAPITAVTGFVNAAFANPITALPPAAIPLPTVASPPLIAPPALARKPVPPAP